MRVDAQSVEAQRAKELVEELQSYFVEKLDKISLIYGEDNSSEALEWLRDGGAHGGGIRYETKDKRVFNRGSVNISQVHYDDDSTKKLSSATAISTIIHPSNPHAPSMHAHISWTQMRDGAGYWRIMGDLNPSLKNDTFREEFTQMLYRMAGEYADEGIEQGDRYFTIPLLNRTRGVSHFYLEKFNRGDFEADYSFAKHMGIAIIDTYIKIFNDALKEHTIVTLEEKEKQIDYHTLYLFQVLTLDRGTTTGLLIHNQNDVGIMGSIPSHVNPELLVSWKELMPKPQELLVQAIIEALPKSNPAEVDIEVKKKLANAVREHYASYPQALKMQASGGVIPDTVGNHK